jgi:hypothetical protein
MSSIFLYGAGFIAGSIYISNLDETKYQFFRKSFYEPHRNYLNLKKYRRQNDMPQSYQDIEIYIKSVFLNATNFFYYNLYGKKQEFNLYKQQNNFELIRNFEFVQETLSDFDKITKSIEERIKKENKKIEEKEIENANLEDELKKDFDDKNIENILLLQENTKDEFIKFQIQNNIQTKKDFDKGILPEMKLIKQINKVAIANAFDDSRKLWEERRKENLYDIRHTKIETKFKSISDLKNKQYLDRVSKNNKKEMDEYGKNKQAADMPPGESSYSDFEDLFNIDKSK